MPVLTETRVRHTARSRVETLHKAAPQVLNEASRTTRTSFDVFLTHSIRDAEIVLGAVTILEQFQLTVYVDWLIDPQLDRETVTSATAERLRARMRQCRALMYLHTDNSPSSRWMPWELGFFDGLKGKVAILPVLKRSDGSFVGQEYLGVYPFVDIATISGSQTESLWVNWSPSEYKHVGKWLT